MKNISLLLISLAFVSSFASAATYTYRCQPFKHSDQGFLGDGHAILTVEDDSIRFQQFDGWGRDPLVRDYVYQTEGLVGGEGKLKGMLEYKLIKEIKEFGDSLDSIYIDAALLNGGYELKVGGKGGRLTFTGHGYNYDWNLCQAVK